MNMPFSMGLFMIKCILKITVLLYICSSVMICFGCSNSKGESIVVGVYGDITTVDPIKLNNKDDFRAAVVYGMLVNIDQYGVFVPGIASQWRISGNGRVYVFYLDELHMFSDGTPITADDVVFSLKRAMSDPKSMISSFFSLVEKIEKINDKAVKIKLARPYMPLLAILANESTGIIKNKTVDNNMQMFKGPFSGPYVVDNILYENGVFKRLDLKMNPFFHMKPDIKKISFQRIEETAIVDKIKNHEIDCIDNLSETVVHQLLVEKDNISKNIKYRPSFGVTFIFLDPSSSVFRDKKIRRKIFSIIHNGDSLERSLLNSISYNPLNQLIPKGLNEYVKNFSLTQYIDKNITHEAMPNKVTLYHLYTTTNANPGIKAAVDLLREHNISTELVLLEKKGDNLNKFYSGGFESGIMDIVPPVTDPFFLFSLFDKNASYSIVKYNNEDYQKNIIRALSEVDNNRRRTYYSKALDILLKNYIFVPISQGKSISYCDDSLDISTKFFSENYIYEKARWRAK